MNDQNSPDTLPGSTTGSVVRTPSGFELQNGSRPHALSALSESGDLPRDWYKWSLGAYLIGLGHSQASAAKSVGVSERTLFRWTKDERWAVFRQCSEELWLVDVYEAARLAVMRKVAEGDTDLAMRILERKLPGLAPAVPGAPGAPIQAGVVINLPPADQGSRAVETLIEIPPPEDR